MKLLNILYGTCSQLLFCVCSFLENPFETSKNSNKKACQTLKHIEARLQQLLSYDTLSDKTEEITSVLYDLKKLLSHHPRLEYRYRDILKHEFSHFSKKEIPYVNGKTGKVEIISFDDARNNKTIAILNADKSDSKYELPRNPLVLNDEHIILGNIAIGQVFIDGKEAFCCTYAVEHSLRSTVARWHYESHQLSILFERM